MSGYVRRLLAFLTILVAFAGADAAAAGPYDLSMRQLKHSVWTRGNGAPAVPHNMAETADGFLWLASRDGLFRFDGLSFEPMDGDIDRARYGAPNKILAARDGSVWAWYPKGWLAQYRQGRLHFIRAPVIRGEIASFTQTPDGAIWIGDAQIGRPFQRYRQGRWETVSPNPNREMLCDAFQSADGAFWLSYNRSVLRRPPNGERFERVDVPVTGPTLLAADADGSVWMVGRSGGRRLSGPGGRWPEPPSRALRWRSQDPVWLKAAFDRSGNLWVAGRDFGRVPGLIQAERAGVSDLVYEEGEASLMTSKRPSTLFVDRRGGVWYGGPRSLDRFSPPSVVSEPDLTASAKYGDILFTATSGAVYIAQSDAVYRTDPGARPVRLFPTNGEPEAMCEDKDGAIWIAMQGGIVRMRNGARDVFSRPPTDTGVYECGADSSGRFWLTASTSGLYWRDGSAWRSASPATFSGPFEPSQKWTDPRGRLWVLSDPDTLFRLDGGFAESRRIDPKLGLGEIRALHSTSLGLLISGRDGAALMSPSGFVRLGDKQTGSLRNATGLVQTSQGETWVFGGAGLARFRTSDLATAFSNPNFRIRERVFGYEDGLPNGANAQLWRSMVRGGDGRLWLATVDGIAWVDPANLPSNPTPPGVAITSLVGGDATVKDPVELRLKSGTSDIVIGFAAISLAMPERVKVLYQLEGHDPEWVDPGRRRQAFYTNLAPGTYRFRVIAANEDGVWNRVGDQLEIIIPPTFLQSIWFKLLVAAALIAGASALYSLRLRQAAAAIEARFHVRTAERERIARELHDTLLQGFQALMLRFQAVSNRLSGDDPLRQDLEQALDRADTVLAEGRSRVRDLRSEAARADLAEAIVEVAGDIDGVDAPAIDVVIEGASKPTNPLVTEELLRIAEEAIRNAVLHARATRISVVLIFNSRYLALVISDDGVGLPAAVRDAGERAGHYGLRGMRERAERIDGRLTLTTKPNKGTEVSVQLPAGAAYPEAANIRGWLRRWVSWEPRFK